jgi:hypothetical protein
MSPHNKQGDSLMTIASKTEAEWIGLQDARKMISTSRVIMLDLIKTRAVKAAQLRVPGKRWGRWVVNRTSLEKYLEKQAAKAVEQGGEKAHATTTT